MAPEDRYRWLWSYINAKASGANILDAKFVDDYAEATGAKVTFTNWGANKCSQLGRDLSHMATNYMLNRTRYGLPTGSWQPGFPKWVWSYKTDPRYDYS